MAASSTIPVTHSAPSDPVYTTVSTKGQVVIPAAIRHELAIEQGTRLALTIEDGHLLMVPQKKLTWRDLRGLTAGGPSMADELIEERRQDLERETAEGW